MTVDDRDLAQIVIETVGALVLVLDREGRVLRWNAACERATGYSREEMVGRPFWDLLLPEEREGVRAVFDELVAGDEAREDLLDRRPLLGRDEEPELPAEHRVAVVARRRLARRVPALDAPLAVEDHHEGPDGLDDDLREVPVVHGHARS